MRRRTPVLVGALLAALLAGCGAPAETPDREPTASGAASTTTAAPTTPSPSSTAASSTAASSSSPTAQARPELPRGGRTVFPQHRLVGFAGHPAAAALGRLGIGDLDARAREIERVARPYASERTILPVLELIATVVQASPGRDGMYRSRSSDALIAEHLAAARRVKGILLLNIQPGRADVLGEVKAYTAWLREPDVGIALDPEWAMGPDEVPMRVFGHMTGAEIDSVSRYLSGLVEEHDLPEKVLVFHQLAPAVVRGEAAIKARRGVAIVKSVDGIGTRDLKEETYGKLTRALPDAVHAGFKLFYEEDARHGPLMTPAQVLALEPQPEYVLYE